MSLMKRHRTIISASAAFLAAVCIVVPVRARFLADDVAPSDAQTAQQQKSPESAFPPDAARNITAIIPSGEKNSIQITWEAQASALDSFVILRASFAISTPDLVQNALQIKIVSSDKLKLVLDRNLSPGRYFYAILPKTKLDQKNIQLFAGENYTTNSIVIAGDTAIDNSRTVGSLKAVTADDRTVLLTWEPVGGFTGEYVIFRSRTPVDTQEKLSAAEPVARVQGIKSRYLDSDAGPGRHFYAVECKTIDGVLYSDLRKDCNITSDPVFVGGVIGIRNIKAQRDGTSVIITWKSAADTLSRNYYLIRTEILPSGKESLAGSYIVDTVQSFSEKYADRNIAPGRYFYILAPANYKDDEDFSLTRGVNVTDPAIIIPDKGQKKTVEKEAVQQESAEHESIAVIAPEMKKTSEGTISRSAKIEAAQPQNTQNTDDSILAKLIEVPVSDAQQAIVLDRAGEPIPFDVIPQKSLPEISAAPKAEKKAAAQNKMVQTQPQLQKETIATSLNSSAEKDPITITSPADINHAEQKQPAKKDEPQIQSSNVDEIVKRLYKHGDFQQTIKELTKILPSIDGKNAAAAKYYIGRSYIELNKYRQAVGYLSDSGVRRYFPKEADFWRDYSLEHMR